MLKKLFYASGSILMLAVAYHFGATSAQGQAGAVVSGFTGTGTTNDGTYFVLTPNGDLFARRFTPGFPTPLTFVGNFWSEGPTPAAQPSFGQLKAQYRK